MQKHLQARNLDGSCYNEGRVFVKIWDAPQAKLGMASPIDSLQL
jgi:hypothetical protein